jgi:hypothetical protein
VARRFQSPRVRHGKPRGYDPCRNGLWMSGHIEGHSQDPTPLRALSALWDKRRCNRGLPRRADRPYKPQNGLLAALCGWGGGAACPKRYAPIGLGSKPNRLLRWRKLGLHESLPEGPEAGRNRPFLPIEECAFPHGALFQFSVTNYASPHPPLGLAENEGILEPLA